MSWTYIASAFGGTTGSQTTVAATVSVSAGNLLIASLGVTLSGTLSIADTGGNSWSEQIDEGNGPSTDQVVCWTAVAATTGSITVTVTCSGPMQAGVNIDVFSVAPGATITVGTAVSSSGLSSNPSTGNVTYSGSGSCLLFGAFMAPSTTTFGAGSGFTAASSHISSVGNYPGLLTEYQTTTSSSSPQACGAYCHNQPWAAEGIPFLEVLANVYPLRAWIQLRARQKNRAVCQVPQFHPPDSAAVYPLRQTVQLRPRKLTAGQSHSPEFHPPTPYASYQLTPSVQLRVRRPNRAVCWPASPWVPSNAPNRLHVVTAIRPSHLNRALNRAVVQSPRLIPANSAAHYPLRPAVQLRPGRRNPAVTKCARSTYGTPAPTYLLPPTVQLRQRRPNRAVLLSPRLIPPTQNARYPLRAATVLRPGRRSAGVVRPVVAMPVVRPAGYTLTASVQLQRRRPARAVTASGRLVPPAPAGPTYSLLPTVQLRQRRFNRAALVLPRMFSPFSRFRTSRPVTILRAGRRNPAAVWVGRQAWEYSPPAVLCYADPRRASVVQIDTDPFGVDPRKAAYVP